MLNDNCLRMQKILDKALPSYLEYKKRHMCLTLRISWLADEITWGDYRFAVKEIETYLHHLGPYDFMWESLQQARFNSSKWNCEQIYRNWADRPMTSPTLEQKWITKALGYGLGIWEGLKTAEHAGDLTRTQVDIVKHSIEQLRREPTMQELKNWVTVQLPAAKEP